MHKQLFVLLTAFSAAVCLAATYDASTGYVTMKASDARWNSTGNSWVSAGKWSDELTPHADTNYYVGAGLEIYNQNAYFGGTNLTVAGDVYVNSGWDWGFGNLVLLPGGRIIDSNGNHLNNAKHTGESFTVRGTVASPSLWESRVSKSTDKRYLRTYFQGDETAYLKFYVLPLCVSREFSVVDYRLTDYHGTFEIGNDIIWTMNWSYDSMPGGCVVAKGGTLRHVGTANTVTMGSLDVRSGGTLEFNETSTFAINKKIALASGAVLKSSFGNQWQTGTPNKRLLFTLGKEAVDVGMPDWSRVDVTCTATGGNHIGPLPRLTNAVEIAEDGSAKIYRTYRPVTSMIKGNSWQISALDPNQDPAVYWSEGEFPKAGRDYETQYSLSVYGTAHPYVFPGDSMTLRYSAAELALYETDVTFNELNLSSGAIVYACYQSYVYHLRGKIHTYMDVTKFGSNSFRVGDRICLNIDADIDGVGDIYIGMRNTAGYQSDRNARGTLALNGDNSGFTGRFVVGMPESVTLAGKTIYPDATNDITLAVSSGAALGGACAAFTYDALTVSNQCRLSVLDDASFTEATRGWYFPNVAYLKVAEGKTAAVSSKITYDAATELVKEGAGTLALASEPLAATGAKLTVAEGALRPDTANALVGLAVTVAPTAKLVLAYEGLPAGGIDLTAEGTSLQPTGARINVDVLAPGVTKEEAKKLETVLFKVPNAQAASFAAALRVTLRTADGDLARRVQVIANSDGTTSSVLLVQSQGLVIMFR